MREPAEPPPKQVPRHLAAAELVYMRKGGQPGLLVPPYNYFNLDICGQHQVVTVDGLKPHTGSTATTPAVPPQRGWPPVVAPPYTTYTPTASGLGFVTRPSSNNEHQTGKRKTTSGKRKTTSGQIRPFSELKGLGGAVSYLCIN